MSTIKVDGIRSNSATSDAITLADNGTCTANITNNLSNRNLIINGAMQVAQRGASSASSSYQTVDRIMHTGAGWDEAMTQSQSDVASGTTPYTLGFRKAFKVQNGNQTSVGGTDTIKIEYKFEAQDLANSGWNYVSSSSNITLSFWVKSSVAQSFKFSFITWDGTARMFPMDTGTLSANTWTKITKTIPGASGITINNDNGLGAQINFFQYLGTDYTGSVTENAWNSYGNPQTLSQTSTWYTTNDATFEITGLQLEVGSTATDFEHRLFGQELALCQRYFQLLKVSDAVGSGSNISFSASLFCPMRATPSLSKTSGNFNFGDMISQSATSSSSPTIDGGYINQDVKVSGYIGGFSGLTNYRSYRHEPSGSNNALLTASAEL